MMDQILLYVSFVFSLTSAILLTLLFLDWAMPYDSDVRNCYRHTEGEQ